MRASSLPDRPGAIGNYDAARIADRWARDRTDQHVRIATNDLHLQIKRLNNDRSALVDLARRSRADVHEVAAKMARLQIPGVDELTEQQQSTIIGWAQALLRTDTEETRKAILEGVTT